MISKVMASLVFLAATAALAHPGHDAPTMPKEFDTLKKLVGSWEGTTKMDGKEEKATVNYTLTSGDTAIMEHLTPGDNPKHEMVSMYYKNGKTLGMTHYCAMGNQPHMVLKKATDNSLAFEMTKPEGVTSMNEPHMHALTITMLDPNTIKQEWVSYEDGKAKGTAVFTFKRK